MDWSVVIMFGGVSCFSFLGLLFCRKICRKEWQKESWEGVVIRKYWRECGGKWVSATFYYVEVCYGQTVKERGLDKESWELVEVGGYVIKKSGSDSIEKRAIQEEEAREARQILIQRLSHESKEIRSRAADALGHIGDERAVQALAEALKDKKKKVRMNAAEALRQIGTPEAIEAAKRITHYGNRGGMYGGC